MLIKKVYTEDIEIAKCIKERNEKVTREFFYKRMYPLFNFIYSNYYTDCSSCKELIDEIYILILTPSKDTGRCRLDNFKGESSLASWLKTVSLFYSYRKFKIRNRIPYAENETLSYCEKDFNDHDRNERNYDSVEIDDMRLNSEDVAKLLELMPKPSYRNLIRLRYLEQLSHRETAEMLGVTMDNYYNMHKRAKEQFNNYYRKEEYHGR